MLTEFTIEEFTCENFSNFPIDFHSLSFQYFWKLLVEWNVN